MGKNKVVKSASIVITITILSKLVGFFRDTLIAKAFGTTFQTDAYNMAITVPNVMFGIFGLAITTTFIPILIETYRNKGKKEMFDFANNIMNILFGMSILLCAFGWIFAPTLVKIIAPKFDGKTYDLTVALTRISVMNILFMSINSGYVAILQTLEDFTAPALVGFMLNLPIIAYILVGNVSIEGLMVATVIGGSMQVLVQLPWLIKHKYRYKFFIDFKDKRIKKMLTLILPIVIGASVNQINAMIDKTIGSGLPEGSITALNFASKVNGLMYSIFGAAIVTVMYPTFASEANEGNMKKFKMYISKSINNINLIMIPATVGIIVLSSPVVKFVFGRGQFNQSSIEMTSIALTFYSLGVIFYGMRDILNRAFYSLQDTRTPMINGVIGVVINIVLNLILVQFMGIGGLALSTSISAFVCAMLLMYSLRKKLGNFNGKIILSSSIKIIISSLVMGGMAKLSYGFLISRLGDASSLFGTIIISAIVYVIMITLLKVNEFFDALKLTQKKLKGRKKITI